MLKKVNLCIVGLGRAGRFHLDSLKQLDSCTLKYVVDPSISQNDKIVTKNEFILIEDIEEVLNDPEIDGVIVTAPTEFHFEYICQSLEAGKHVFTEKPLGKSAKEIKICFDLANKKGLALYLGFQRRYDTNFIELKNSIEKIAPVRTVKMSSRDNPKPSLSYLKISGNIFHDMLIHDFDMLQFLLGYKIPISVFAYGHAYDPDIKKIPDFDTVLVTLKYADGLMCSIDTSRIAAYGYDQRIELFGEEGMAIAENQKDNTVEVHTHAGSHQNPINYSFPQRYKGAYLEEISDFVNGLQTGKNHNITEKQCLLGHLIADAAHESAITNSVIDFHEKYKEELS